MRIYRIYVGTFLIAAATLAIEITLTRILSVITWYHLSFFAIATALLGMTAGSTTVYLNPKWFVSSNLNRSICRACLAFAMVMPITLLLLAFVPALILNLGGSLIIQLLFFAVGAFLPFYCAGIAISAILTKQQVSIGTLYASDLMGAALGSLLVLAGLELFDALSLVLIQGAIGAIAAFMFAGENIRLRRASIGLAILMLAFGLINASVPFGIKPLVVKGRIDNLSDIYIDKWNSFSRIVVHNEVFGPPQYAGASPKAPQSSIHQYEMDIDGDANTFVRQFHTNDDINHLRYDVTNMVHYLRPSGKVMIIGVGGGKDIQSALLFGHSSVLGVELNPIFVNLLQGQFGDFAGLAGRKDVTLVIDEGRSYASRTSDKFSVIQMALVDTWAATGAGAFTLSENGLYTVEAWRIFFSRLSDDGIFTVSRWHDPTGLGETGRVVSLATATLLQEGIADPAGHIALITSNMMSTLLVSKQAFSAADIALLEKTTSDLEFQLTIVPGKVPEHPVLQSIVGVHSLPELQAVTDNQTLNFTPPTDDAPYFFNMLKLNHIADYVNLGAGVVIGNIIATFVLIMLIVLLIIIALITIILPLLLRRRTGTQPTHSPTEFWAGGLYFSLIGAGFMFIEIGLVQRLSVYLGHPIYALGILLFTIIASTGVGSTISERLPLTRTPLLQLYPMMTVVAILAERFLLPILISNTLTAPIPTKAILSIVVIFPMGILMGFFFPTGIRLAQRVYNAEIPWFWALNGVFSVFVSALAVFISIYFSVSLNFYLGAVCYVGTLIALYFMSKRGQYEMA